MPYRNIVLQVLFSIVSLVLKAQTVEEVITKYINFTGGEQAWKKVNSIVTKGTYNYGGMPFPFTAYSKAPDKYRFVVPFKGKYFAQAFDGKKGWKIDAFKNETNKTILTGKPALAMANEADVELESPFINYPAKGHKAVIEASDTVNGTTCFKVKLIKSDGDNEIYFFDKESCRLVQKQAVSKNAELDSSVLDIFYADYRNVNGVKIPFKTISKSNGQTILTITIDKAEINVPIPDTDFEP